MADSYTDRLIQEATVGTNLRMGPTGEVYEKPLEHHEVNFAVRKLAGAMGRLEARIAAIEGQLDANP